MFVVINVGVVDPPILLKQNYNAVVFYCTCSIMCNIQENLIYSQNTRELLNKQFRCVRQTAIVYDREHVVKCSYQKLFLSDGSNYQYDKILCKRHNKLVHSQKGNPWRILSQYINHPDPERQRVQFQQIPIVRLVYGQFKFWAYSSVAPEHELPDIHLQHPNYVPIRVYDEVIVAIHTEGKEFMFIITKRRVWQTMMRIIHDVFVDLLTYSDQFEHVLMIVVTKTGRVILNPQHKMSFNIICNSKTLMLEQMINSCTRLLYNDINNCNEAILNYHLERNDVLHSNIKSMVMFTKSQEMFHKLWVIPGTHHIVDSLWERIHYDKINKTCCLYTHDYGQQSAIDIFTYSASYNFICNLLINLSRFLQVSQHLLPLYAVKQFIENMIDIPCQAYHVRLGNFTDLLRVSKRKYFPCDVCRLQFLSTLPDLFRLRESNDKVYNRVNKPLYGNYDAMAEKFIDGFAHKHRKCRMPIELNCIVWAFYQERDFEWTIMAPILHIGRLNDSYTRHFISAYHYNPHDRNMRLYSASMAYSDSLLFSDWWAHILFDNHGADRAVQQHAHALEHASKGNIIDDNIFHVLFIDILIFLYVLFVTYDLMIAIVQFGVPHVLNNINVIRNVSIRQFMVEMFDYILHTASILNSLLVYCCTNGFIRITILCITLIIQWFVLFDTTGLSKYVIDYTVALWATIDVQIYLCYRVFGFPVNNRTVITRKMLVGLLTVALSIMCSLFMQLEQPPFNKVRVVWKDDIQHWSDYIVTQSLISNLEIHRFGFHAQVLWFIYSVYSRQTWRIWYLVSRLLYAVDEFTYWYDPRNTLYGGHGDLLVAINCDLKWYDFKIAQYMGQTIHEIVDPNLKWSIYLAIQHPNVDYQVIYENVQPVSFIVPGASAATIMTPNTEPVPVLTNFSTMWHSIFLFPVYYLLAMGFSYLAWRLMRHKLPVFDMPCYTVNYPQWFIDAFGVQSGVIAVGSIIVVPKKQVINTHNIELTSTENGLECVHDNEVFHFVYPQDLYWSVLKDQGPYVEMTVEGSLYDRLYNDILMKIMTDQQVFALIWFIFDCLFVDVQQFYNNRSALDYNFTYQRFGQYVLHCESSVSYWHIDAIAKRTTYVNSYLYDRVNAQIRMDYNILDVPKKIYSSLNGFMMSHGLTYTVQKVVAINHVMQTIYDTLQKNKFRNAYYVLAFALTSFSNAISIIDDQDVHERTCFGGRGFKVQKPNSFVTYTKDTCDYAAQKWYSYNTCYSHHITYPKKCICNALLAVKNRQNCDIIDDDPDSVNAFHKWVTHNSEKLITCTQYHTQSQQEWCDMIPGNKRTLKANAILNNQERGYLPYAQTRVKAFMKIEPLNLKERDVQPNLQSIDPRLISGRESEYDVIAGHVIKKISKVFSTMWSFKDNQQTQCECKRIPGITYFSSGHDKVSAGQWFQEQIALGNKFYNTDYKRFDATTKQHMLILEHAIYQMFCDDQAFKDWCHAQLNTNGQIEIKDGKLLNKINYYCNGTRKSGDQNTSIGNTIINVLCQVYALSLQIPNAIDLIHKGLLNIIALGDDTVLSIPSELTLDLNKYSKTIAQLGLHITIEQQKPESVAFCSSYFVPASVNGEETYILTQKIGRNLARAYTTELEMQPLYRAGWIKSNAYAYMLDYRHIPSMYSWHQRIYANYIDVRAVPLVDEEYHVNRALLVRPSIYLDAWLQANYNLNDATLGRDLIVKDPLDQVFNVDIYGANQPLQVGTVGDLYRNNSPKKFKVINPKNMPLLVHVVPYEESIILGVMDLIIPVMTVENNECEHVHPIDEGKHQFIDNDDKNDEASNDDPILVSTIVKKSYHDVTIKTKLATKLPVQPLTKKNFICKTLNATLRKPATVVLQQVSKKNGKGYNDFMTSLNMTVLQSIVEAKHLQKLISIIGVYDGLKELIEHKSNHMPDCELFLNNYDLGAYRNTHDPKKYAPIIVNTLHHNPLDQVLRFFTTFERVFVIEPDIGGLGGNVNDKLYWSTQDKVTTVHYNLTDRQGHDIKIEKSTHIVFHDKHSWELSDNNGLRWHVQKQPYDFTGDYHVLWLFIRTPL